MLSPWDMHPLKYELQHKPSKGFSALSSRHLTDPVTDAAGLRPTRSPGKERQEPLLEGRITSYLFISRSTMFREDFDVLNVCRGTLGGYSARPWVHRQ